MSDIKVDKHFTPDWVSILTGAAVFSFGFAFGFLLGCGF